MRRCILTFVLVLAALAVGCKKEPASAIVEKVKRAGAGEVEHASQVSIAQWIGSKGAAYADALFGNPFPTVRLMLYHLTVLQRKTPRNDS